MTYMLPESEILRKRFYAQRAIQHRVDIDRLWKLFPLLPQEVGRPLGDGVLPEDESSSSSSSSSSSATICFCDTSYLFQTNISGIASSCCSQFNRTWTLAYNPIFTGCSWSEQISPGVCSSFDRWRAVFTTTYTPTKCAVQFQRFAVGSTTVFTVIKTFSLDKSLFLCGGTNVFSDALFGTGCSGWPSTITVSKV